jgi:type IV pilus assembly protein PilA
VEEADNTLGPLAAVRRKILFAAWTITRASRYLKERELSMRSIAINRKRKGFTLIELLIVILILAVLMAVALPLYLGAVADSEKKTARANMQTIANALQSAKVKATDHAYPADWTTLIASGDITAQITGPGTRTYSWGLTGTGGAPVISSGVAADSTYEPGKDSN